MGLLTPNNIKDFRSLYTLQLRYLLSAENQIVEGLESMIEHADDAQLIQAFQSHREETQVHVTRLEELISEVNEGDVDDKKDAIAAALIGSGDNIVSESEEGPVRDADCSRRRRRLSIRKSRLMDLPATGRNFWACQSM